MIAKVRIAPVEHWCDYYQPLISRGYDVIAGMGVEIITDSMALMNEFQCLEPSRTGECNGRTWDVSVESQNEIADRLGENRLFPMSATLRVCEHMLEMD